MSTRFYPTDLLLAVQDVERLLAEQPQAPVARLLRERGLTALWSGAELTAGLDQLFDGLAQYPWQPLVDTDDVLLQEPVGTVVLDDRRAGNTLRGLLLAWATGNAVVVRTDEPALWDTVMAALRDGDRPLPPGRTAAPGLDVPGGEHVEVPDVVAPAAWADGAVVVTEQQAGPGALAVRPQESADSSAAGTFLAEILRLDCRDSWVGRLQRVSYLRGTRLSAARAADADQAEPRIAARLRYLVAQARRHPHYQDLPVVTGRQDLPALPVLEKGDLERGSLPFGRELCSGATPSGEVLRSGATSGSPRYIVYSRTDWDNMVREAIPVLYELGLRPGDRIVNTLFGGSLYGGLVTSQNEIARMPVEAYSTGQAVTAEDMVLLGRSFSVNAVLGMPTLLLPLLRDAKARHPELRVEKVLYGGSPMTESDKTWLREQVGARVVASVLAANDGAQLGYQCRQMSGTLHHVCDDYNLLEVVDEDGTPLPDGQVGEILVTTMQKFEAPLIRYRIGDLGRIFEYSCGCGLSGRVLEYLGRSDGLIKARSETMLYSDLVAELERFRVSRVQVEITTAEQAETVIVRTESPEPLDPELVRKHLSEAIPLLGVVQEFETTEDYFGFVVECLPEGALPRHPVSGKIKPIVDRRIQ